MAQRYVRLRALTSKAREGLAPVLPLRHLTAAWGLFGPFVSLSNHVHRALLVHCLLLALQLRCPQFGHDWSAV